jgi:hypothetical protein
LTSLYHITALFACPTLLATLWNFSHSLLLYVHCAVGRFAATQVTILNRSLPRAQALQEEFPDMQMDIRLMPDLMQCVEDSDVVFAASGAALLFIGSSSFVVL